MSRKRKKAVFYNLKGWSAKNKGLIASEYAQSFSTCTGRQTYKIHTLMNTPADFESQNNFPPCLRLCSFSLLFLPPSCRHVWTVAVFRICSQRQPTAESESVLVHKPVYKMCRLADNETQWLSGSTRDGRRRQRKTTKSVCECEKSRSLPSMCWVDVYFCSFCTWFLLFPFFAFHSFDEFEIRRGDFLLE